MNSGRLGIGDLFLLISVALLNYGFLSMWKILYGSYFHIRPTWKWGKDLGRLKLLASQADDPDVRGKCTFILFVFYISGILLLIGLIVGAII